LEEEQPLFQSTTVRTPEKRFKYNSLSRLISNLMKKAEIKSPRITAHSLRHTTATLNIINGGTLEETRDLLRHESFETTKRYLHHVDAITNQSSNRVNDLLDIKSK
jgi:integrase/recombinase XerC